MVIWHLQRACRRPTSRFDARGGVFPPSHVARERHYFLAVTPVNTCAQMPPLGPLHMTESRLPP